MFAPQSCNPRDASRHFKSVLICEICGLFKSPSSGLIFGASNRVPHKRKNIRLFLNNLADRLA